MVYLFIKNIITKRPNKKLNNKFISPYPIIKKISKNNYQLNLPPKVKIHPIFHISLLKSAVDTIKIHTQTDNVKIKNEQEYEPKKILNFRQNKNGITEYEIK